MCDDPAEEIKKGIDTWGSHLSTLKWAVSQTSGPILEVGGGFYSTPFLASNCRELWTVEENPKWLEFYQKIYNHQLVSSISELPDKYWSVVLVDTVQIEPRISILKSLDFHIGIIHDLPSFSWTNELDWKYKSTRFDLNTTIVSNDREV